MPTLPERLFTPEWPRPFVRFERAATLPDGVRLHLYDADGMLTPATLQLLAGGVVRLSIGSRPPRRRTLLAVRPSPAAARLTESARGLVIEGAGVRVHLQHEGPFLEVEDGQGHRFVTCPLADGGFDSTVDRTLGVATSGLAWLDAPLQPGEAVYGLGEQFGALDHRGQTASLWAEDAFGLPATEAYITTPYLMSTAGYALFLDTASPTRWDMGETLFGRLRVTIAEPAFDLYCWLGSLPTLLAGYQTLTGPAALPPRWSYGVWMSRWGYRDQEELLAIAHQLRDRRLPCDVIHLDPYWLTEKNGHTCPFEWDREAFPDPAGMIAELRTLGFHLSLWINPFLPRDSRVWEEAHERGYLVRTEAGTPARIPRFDDESGVVDFTNPDAAAWYQSLLRPLLDLGVSVFKSDFGESVPFSGVRFFDPEVSGPAARNLNPLLYQKAVFEVTAAAHPEGALVWGRSGYAGVQRYPLQWGGDSGVTFEYMATSLRGALNFGLSGAAFTAFDGGGFAGTPDPEVYMRWAAMALLFSHTRFHGTSPREPWEMGEEAEAIFRRFADLRYQLLPYLDWASRDAVERRLPLARPLVLMDPEDRNTWHLDDVYGLGPDLVVAPLFNREGTRDVYLPAGRYAEWFHPELVVEGRRWHRRERVPFSEIPLYQRVGTAIPLYPSGLQTVPAATNVPTRYRLVLPDADGPVSGAPGLSLRWERGILVAEADHAATLELPGRETIELAAAEPTPVGG